MAELISSFMRLPLKNKQKMSFSIILFMAITTSKQIFLMITSHRTVPIEKIRVTMRIVADHCLTRKILAQPILRLLKPLTAESSLSTDPIHTDQHLCQERLIAQA